MVILLKPYFQLTHWGRATHLCVSKLTSIAPDNGLSPGRRQAITWTNAGILLIGPLGTNFSEILSEIHTFSFKKIRLKISSGKWRPFCVGLNVLTNVLTIGLLNRLPPEIPKEPVMMNCKRSIEIMSFQYLDYILKISVMVVYMVADYGCVFTMNVTMTVY